MGGLVDKAVEVFTYGTVDDLSGADEAAKQSQKATSQAVGAQREALEYLKEREALPQQFREGALTQLADIYGLTDVEGAEAQFIEDAKMSPLYQAILGTQEAGEEAILRQASATGGLRSGNVQDALAENAQQLENQALLQAYNQRMRGLEGIAQLPSNATQIANLTAGIGQTQAQGTIGAAQSSLMAQNQLVNQLMGAGQTAALAFSDIRLKENIEYIGKINGHNIYSWDWNGEAKALGLEGSDEGVMAHEVFETHPEAIWQADGYLMVDYGSIYNG